MALVKLSIWLNDDGTATPSGYVLYNSDGALVAEYSPGITTARMAPIAAADELLRLFMAMDGYQLAF